MEREFSDVAKDLETILSEIQGTKDPALRQSLLRDMQVLLKEADQLLLAKDPLPQIQSAARPKQ